MCGLSRLPPPYKRQSTSRSRPFIWCNILYRRLRYVHAAPGACRLYSVVKSRACPLLGRVGL